MKKITRVVAAGLSVLMILGTKSIQAFALPSIHSFTIPEVVVNTKNIHDVQVEGVEYTLSPITELKSCEAVTGDVIKSWSSTTTADVLNLSAGDYKLLIGNTPKNYFATEDDICFTLAEDGTVTTFDVNWHGEKFDEVVTEDSTLNNVLHYRDGYIVKNETGDGVRFFFAQKIGKNIVGMDDTTAMFAVYNADGSVKPIEDISVEKIRNRVNLYDVTLKDGECFELYDIHSEGLYIYAKKTEDTDNEFVFEDTDRYYNVYTKENVEAASDMKLHEPLVSEELTDWQGVKILPCMNDETGKDFNLGGGGDMFAWGRSSIPHTIILKEKPDDVHVEGGKTSSSEIFIEVEPTPTPTIEPTPIITPTVTPTIESTPTPTITPVEESTTGSHLHKQNHKVEPTAAPTVEPTVEPAAAPAVEPTVEPAAAPAEPTVEPAAAPAVEPSVEPATTPAAESIEEPIITPDVKSDEEAAVTPAVEESDDKEEVSVLEDKNKEKEETKTETIKVNESKTDITKENTIPKTGDTSNLMFWLALMSVSAVGCAVCLCNKVKSKKVKSK